MKDYQYHIFSPYRVCPLGAHVDHQHGLVTGFAINKGVDLWFNVNEETPSGSPCIEGEKKSSINREDLGGSHVHLESKTFEGVVDFDIDKPSQVREHHWGDYARGAKYALRKRFELKRGITGVIQGSLPVGGLSSSQGSLPVGGLSSSAAVLIAYVMAFAKANDITLQPFEVVKIASEAEREYIGLNNGLLDQSCIALSKKNQLLFLDCDSDDYRLIPFGGQTPSGSPCLGGEKKSSLNREDIGGSLPFEIGIFFSGLTRSLVNSDYNLRVYECKTAAWNMLAYQEQPLKTFDKTFLRDVPKETFEKTRDIMPARFARRAEHFYSEYRRVRHSESFPSPAVRAASTTTNAARQSSSPSMRSCAVFLGCMVADSQERDLKVLVSRWWILPIRKTFRRCSQRNIWNSSLNMKRPSRCSG